MESYSKCCIQDIEANSAQRIEWSYMSLSISILFFDLIGGMSLYSLEILFYPTILIVFILDLWIEYIILLKKKIVKKISLAWLLVDCILLLLREKFQNSMMEEKH